MSEYEQEQKFQNGDGQTESTYSSAGNEFGVELRDEEQFKKLFVGGLSFKTEEPGLKEYFGKYGEISDCVVMRDPQTKRSRGFGFVTFSNSGSLESAQKARPHKIDGKPVETKRAMPREESDSPEAHMTVQKLWLGGLTDTHSEEMLKEYFTKFGKIEKVEIMVDRTSGRVRGFGFITFDDSDAVDKIVLYKPHMIGDKRIDVKKAVARGEAPPPKTGGRGRGRGRGGYGAPSGGGYGMAPSGGYGSPGYGSSAGGYGSQGAYDYSGYADPSRAAGQWYGGGSAQYSGYGAGYQAGYPAGGAYGSGAMAGQSSGYAGYAAGTGASFGSGYAQSYDGGPMRSASGYAQRAPGPYAGAANSGTPGAAGASASSYGATGGYYARRQ